MNVFVYRNVTKKCWSVKDVATGRVIMHADELVLCNATFKVAEAGRLRVLREKRKNVHAGVRGRLVAGKQRVRDLKRVLSHGAVVRYNPYHFKTFVLAVGEHPVYRAEWVYLKADGDVRVIGQNNRWELAA